MNNKILAALALTTALATGLQAQCQINSGAYVGLSLGGAHLGGKNELKTDNAVLGAVNPESSLKLSSSSLAATIFGGYGMRFGSLWAAAELFYQFDKLASKNTSNIDPGAGTQDVVGESKSSGAFGGALHIGYMPTNNSIIYAIIGAEVRRFKVTQAQVNHPTSINKSYTSTAFAPGLGLRVSLSKNISIKTEYKYAMHRSKSFSDTKIVGGGNETMTVKHNPQVHSINVGLVYSF